MDNNNVNIILEKKLESYGAENKDFIAPQELTVTITLNEYRTLVTETATKTEDIKEANRERYKYKTENEKLKEEIAELKAKLYECTLDNQEEKGDN